MDRVELSINYILQTVLDRDLFSLPSLSISISIPVIIQADVEMESEKWSEIMKGRS